MMIRGVRSFTARAVSVWEPGRSLSLDPVGFESFNGKREAAYTLLEVRVHRYRQIYNRIRPHSSGL